MSKLWKQLRRYGSLHKARKDSAEYNGNQKIYNIRIDSAEHVLVTFDDIKVQQ